jgi:hypothetical protein
MAVYHATKKREKNRAITHLLIEENNIWEAKQRVIDNIEGAYRNTYLTKPPDGKSGAMIKVIAHHFLRTDATDIKADSIEELPTE